MCVSVKSMHGRIEKGLWKRERWKLVTINIDRFRLKGTTKLKAENRHERAKNILAINSIEIEIALRRSHSVYL